MADKYFNFKPVRSHSGILKKVANPTLAAGSWTGSFVGGGAATAGVFTNATYSKSFGLVNPLVGTAGAIVGVQMSQSQISVSLTFEPRSSGTIAETAALGATIQPGDIISLHHVEVAGVGTPNDDEVSALINVDLPAADEAPTAASSFHVLDVTETNSLSDNRQFTVNAIQYEGGAFVELS